MSNGGPKDINKIRVLHRGRFAGTLIRNSRGAKFEYAPEYLSNDACEGIALHMPKRAAPFDVEGANLHPFFAGLLPEGLRLKAIISGLKTSEDDLFSIFVALGSTCVGDVSPEELNPTKPIPAPKLSEIRFHEYFEQLLRKPLETLKGQDHFAGVQNKISASMINFPINIAKRERSYILKLNNKEYPNVVANEHACLKLAKRCGLQVVSAKIVRDSVRQEGLLVERFDRVWNGEAKLFEQIHVEDACQFLDLYPADRYRVSMRQIVEGIQRWSPVPHLDILRLIEQYVFSYLIGNGDMHAKNVSLIREPGTGRIFLSPAYDLVSTLPYPLDANMALRIDGKDDNFRRRTFLDFGTRFQVPPSLLTKRLQQLIGKFEKNLPSFLSEMSPILKNDAKSSQMARTITRRLKGLA